jgi:hypothetical protein
MTAEAAGRVRGSLLPQQQAGRLPLGRLNSSSLPLPQRLMQARMLAAQKLVLRLSQQTSYGRAWGKALTAAQGRSRRLQAACTAPL